MLERDRVPRATVPAVSSRRWIWRIERRGFSRLAARIAVWTAVESFDWPRSARTLGISPSRPRAR